MNDDDGQNASVQGGTLYLVGTPIGNLGDLSPRAIGVLRAAQLILAEDTRSFGLLASRFGIDGARQSFHEHNERGRIPGVLERLRRRESVALVSEAGMPAISDPGYRIVAACRAEGIPVEAVPGPCAAILAVAISGFPTNRFVFEGFVPQKKGRRVRFVRTLLACDATVVCYESPYRIVETVRLIAEEEPARPIFIGRELTKRFEEHIFGSASEVLTKLEQRDRVKGEIVLVVRGSARSDGGDNEPGARLTGDLTDDADDES